ncbi:MAG: DUF2147 domain-containing protein [Bacteroidales bacterium]|nr:DUF2147 domain-containing protein [Bacteroidales bacterium]
MKKLTLILIATIALIGSVSAQNKLNDKAENIVGTYQGTQGDDLFKVAITQQNDGSFKGQIIWLEKDKDANGKKLLDVKNPDKSLRNVPSDQVVLFSGLKYNAKKKRWDDTKIYDPQRGIRVSMNASFTDDGQLKIKGTVMGIGESVYWKKIQTP